MNDPRKQKILDLLDAFVRQRPGMEPCNYGSWASYRAESRQITRDLHDYRTLRSAIAWRDSITADMLIEGFAHAYCGRLSIKETDKRFSLDYCTGQYFPTEYRRAACAVLAHALWYRKREDITSEYKGTYPDSLGTIMRSSFRKEFGARLQRAYLD